MLKDFNKIKTEDIQDNCFKLIGSDWMLITAGNPEKWNTMTASWGQLGVLWNLPVAICYIRPHRFTYKFAESNDYYTLSFFDDKYRPALQFCGSKSGRHFDKAKETGLISFSTELENISFVQARLILECKKLYADDLKAGSFLEERLIERNYPKKDFHRFYIGEVVNSWVKK